MSKEMVISANPHETRVAILEEGQLCEFYVEREKEFALVGSIYKGRVTRVLPGMQSAFVEIGLDSDAFLYVSDFLEDNEEFDQIVTTVEDKVEKMQAEGGQVFAPEGAATPAIEPTDVEPPQPLSNESGMSPDASGAPAYPSSPPIRSAPPASQPSAPPRSYDRGRSDHRRPEGRSEGRREGRFGRRGRGGRDRGGDRGRFGGGGGGGRDRGGRGRFGRDLPPSKYAPSHGYEDRPSDSSLPEGHVSTILPGESLAKYKERSSAPPTPPVEEISTAAVTPITHETAPMETAPPAFIPPRQEYRPVSSTMSTGLEPLPGETISKWKVREPHEEDRSEAAIPTTEHHAEIDHHQEIESRELASFEPEVHEDQATFDAHAQQAIQAAHGFEAAHEIHAAGLTDEEASVVAEQVAEAQVEQQEREARQRDFAAQEESHDAGASEADHDDEASELGADHGTEEMDAEEDAEEAQAEAEGMLAHPEEFAHAEAPEAESMTAEPGNSLAAEGQQPHDPQTPDQQPYRAQVSNNFRARMQHPARRGRSGPRRDRDDRGRRPQHGPSHGGHHRAQPRRPQLISDMLKQGQEIIVQIAKEPLGKKGARITSHVALPGRYLVYMPTLDHTGVSRKIISAEDRARLRHLVSEAKGTSGGGFIVRTAAGGATPDEIRTDVEFLIRTWSEIKARAEQRKAPALLHRDLNLVERILRDYITTDYNAIWVDSEEEYAKVVEFMSRFQPQLVNRVKLYTKETPVFEEFGIQQEIDKSLRPKVWLKSGGYIVINHTEALVAIDVNTGKFVGKGSNRLEDTIVRTNLEAVKEVVRQMRLRDLGGIIIIDFIDMEERRNREKVMAALEDALRADRAPSKVLRFNEFGLVAITRKRTKQALERTLCQPCPYCTGSGMVKSIPTLCYEIQGEARKMAPEISSGSLTLRVHPEISKALKTRESSLIEELERWTKKSIIVQADPTLHWEQYDIY